MMNRALKLHPYLAILWAGIVIFFIAFSTYSIVVKKNIQTDLLALLPQKENSLLRESQNFMDDSRLQNRMVILVGHKYNNTAHKGFSRLTKTIQSLPLTIQNPQQTAEHYKNFFKNLR